MSTNFDLPVLLSWNIKPWGWTLVSASLKLSTNLPMSTNAATQSRTNRLWNICNNVCPFIRNEFDSKVLLVSTTVSTIRQCTQSSHIHLTCFRTRSVLTYETVALMGRLSRNLIEVWMWDPFELSVGRCFLTPFFQLGYFWLTSSIRPQHWLLFHAIKVLASSIVFIWEMLIEEAFFGVFCLIETERVCSLSPPNPPFSGTVAHSSTPPLEDNAACATCESNNGKWNRGVYDLKTRTSKFQHLTANKIAD